MNPKHESAREQGSMAESARDELRKATEAAKQTGLGAAERVKDDARSFVSRQKELAAEEMSHIGAAIERAADKLRAEDDHNIAAYAEAAARQAQAASRYLRQHESSELLSDAEELTRRHPGAVCGSMFVAGLAIARFLKASQPSRMQLHATSTAGDHRAADTVQAL